MPERSPATRHDLVISQHAVPIAQNNSKPVSSSAAAAGAASSSIPAAAPTSTISVLSEIETLLLKVNDLSHKIPFSSDRMSRISGLFPPGHGPSAEAVEKQNKHEVQLLDSLRSTLSFTRSGFSMFGKQQDSFCNEYEAEAVVIESQIREQGLPVDKSTPPANSEFFPDTVLGQSPGEAEVMFLVSCLCCQHICYICIINYFILSFYFVVLSLLACRKMLREQRLLLLKILMMVTLMTTV